MCDAGCGHVLVMVIAVQPESPVWYSVRQASTGDMHVPVRCGQTAGLEVIHDVFGERFGRRRFVSEDAVTCNIQDRRGVQHHAFFIVNIHQLRC